MGSATLELSSLELSRTTDLPLPLQDPARPDASLGEILLTVTLNPKTQEDKEQVRIDCCTNILNCIGQSEK